MQVGDWYTENFTGRLVEIRDISDGQITVVPIEDIGGGAGIPFFVTTQNLISNFSFAPATETIDDVLNDYAGYDYDQKFYRIAFVSLTCRIKRAAG